MRLTPGQVDKLLRNPAVFLLLAGGAGTGLGIVALVLIVVFWKQLQWALSEQWVFSIIMIAVSIGVILTVVPGLILIERKVASWMQDRIGPNRVGWWGLLQSAADGLKFLLKEDMIPRNVDKPLFLLAPGIAVAVSLLGIAIIPWAGEVRWPWMSPTAAPITTQVAPLDVGFLYFLAVGSLGVYGVVLAGYASNNKYAFYGGLRATAQMLSYEIPMGLGLLTLLLFCGSLRLDTMVNQQANGMWFVFYQPVAFLLVLISGYAEANRTPFDLAEAEQELVGGYHTEYGAMKFAMFFLGEYVHMVIGSALVVSVFFGGWHIWGGPGVENVAWWAMILKFIIFWAKVAVFLFLFLAIRWTIPRFRFDQLMRMAWTGMVPAGVALVLGMGLLVALGWHRSWFANIGLNIGVVAVMLIIMSRSKRPVTGRQDYLLKADALERAAEQRGRIVERFA